MMSLLSFTPPPVEVRPPISPRLTPRNSAHSGGLRRKIQFLVVLGDWRLRAPLRSVMSLGSDGRHHVLEFYLDWLV